MRRKKENLGPAALWVCPISGKNGKIMNDQRTNIPKNVDA
jgi:hypothetical protein